MQSVVERAIKSIKYAYELRTVLFPRPVFDAIVVLVPYDYDCGETANAIIRALPHSYINQNVYVVNVLGHHSCEALNNGMEILATLGMDYAIVLSNKALQTLTSGTIEAMLEAFNKGAKIIGVAIDELQDVVLEGRVQNTFAGWDVRALRGVGGFDSEKGVEEVSSTVRLIRRHGPCIAVLDPEEKPALHIRESADGKAHHEEVLTTKIARSTRSSACQCRFQVHQGRYHSWLSTLGLILSPGYT